MFGASSELASVMEFGFKYAQNWLFSENMSTIINLIIVIYEKFLFSLEMFAASNCHYCYNCLTYWATLMIPDVSL